MKKIFLLIAYLSILNISGCLSGGGGSDDSSSSSSSNNNNNNTSRTVTGYAKGKIPVVYEPSSSAPSHALTNPSEWLVTLTEVTDNRSAAPNNEGEFSIPIYSSDYLSTNAKIKITKNSKVISGNSILENAVIYAVGSTDSIIQPTIALGFFSNGTYTIFENTSEASSLYTAWSKVASKDYTGASADFTSILGSTTSESTKASANAGLGWSNVKKNGRLSDGSSYFQLAAASNNLAKLGMNYVYISTTENIKTAITNFEAMGFNNSSFKYNEAEIIGITNQEIYASLAYCYIYIGDYESASSISNNFSGSSEDVTTQVSKIIREFGIN